MPLMKNTWFNFIHGHFYKNILNVTKDLYWYIRKRVKSRFTRVSKFIKLAFFSPVHVQWKKGKGEWATHASNLSKNKECPADTPVGSHRKDEKVIIKILQLQGLYDVFNRDKHWVTYRGSFTIARERYSWGYAYSHCGAKDW